MRGDPPERILTHPSSFPSAFLVCALRWLPSGVGSTRRADPARRAARSRHLRHAAAGQTPAHLDEEHPAPRAFRQPEHRRARPAERSSEYFSGIWRNARLIYPPVSCRRLPSQPQEKTTESAPDSFPPRTQSSPPLLDYHPHDISRTMYVASPTQLWRVFGSSVEVFCGGVFAGKRKRPLPF